MQKSKQKMYFKFILKNLIQKVKSPLENPESLHWFDILIFKFFAIVDLQNE